MTADAAPAGPGLTAGRKVGIVALVVVDFVWLAGFVTAVGLVDAFDYTADYDPGWRFALGVLAAAVPLVVLARSRGRRLLLAWGILLASALLLFGVCLAGA